MGRKILVILSLICIFLGGYFWGIPAFVNSNFEIIKQITQNSTGFNLELSNPKIRMGIVPSVYFKADSFALINKDSSKALSLKNPRFAVKILPLLFKKFEFENYYADEIKANLIFTEDKKLLLGDYTLNAPQNNKLKLNKIVLDIKNLEINLDDKFQSKKLSLFCPELKSNFSNNKQAQLITQGEFSSGRKKTEFKIDVNLKLPLTHIKTDQLKFNGELKDLDLADFSEYANTFSGGEIKELAGIINFYANTEQNKTINTVLRLDNLKIALKDGDIKCDRQLTFKSNISTIQNGIFINKAEVATDGINSFFSGKVNSLNSKFPHLDLKVSINKSDASKILSLLPPLEIPDINLKLLKQTGFWGNVIGNLEIKGKADLPNIYGNILVSDAYIVKPILNAEKASIKLKFNGDKFNLDVKVPTSPSQTVFVKGDVNLDKEKNADLNITSTDKVDLKTAQIVLNPLHEILHFELGPVPIMDIKGEGGINLHVTGNRKNPHGWGQFHFNNATVSFTDIHNMIIKNGSGILNFNNQNTFFKSNSAYLNGKPLDIKGTCSLLGILDFDIKTSHQDLTQLLKIIKTSPMLDDIQKITSNIENGSGPVNLSIKLTGQVKNPNDIVFNKNIFAKGNLELISNTLKLKGLEIPISKVSGLINFENLNADFKLISSLNNSKININGKIKDNICNLKAESNRFNLADGLTLISSKIPYKNDFATIYSDFIAKYYGKIDVIDYDKIYLKGNIHSNKGAKTKIVVNNSNFELNNSNFKLPSLTGTFKGSPYNISLNVSRIFYKNKLVNGNCKINSLDLNLINDAALQLIIPVEISNQLKNIEFENGNLNLNAQIKNNNLNAFSVLNDINFIYKPQNMKVLISNGSILVKNNRLNLNKISALVGNMPVFINGKISNIQSSNPFADVYLNVKPTQEFFDKFYNNNSVYPIKLKGDINLTSKILGDINNLNSKSTLNIDENSNIYYMGASIGDVENPVQITLDCTNSLNKIKINNLKYDKIITSQNNKPYVKNQLNASGTLNILKNNIIGFNNFKIVTNSPTDAKIFNIIFRKPIMKQGVFSSNIVLNGTSINPKIKGVFDITSIDMPFFDSTVKDVNFDFQNNKIFIKSKGTILTNDVLLNAVLKNKLTPPYIIEDLKLKLSDLNINKITNSLIDYEAESIRKPNITTVSEQAFDPSQIVIQKADIKADKIQVRNINADNFEANLRLNDKMLLNVDNFKFNLAEGIVSGSLNYNILNRIAGLDIHLNNANALIMSEAMFDLKGQVYGSVNGDFNLICNTRSNDSCFKTLSGEGSFKIANGKMPKLGSLEYLLKAGNLIKGGFTGLSINSLIDLITPLKTGEFESISGDIRINQGIADKINIYSSGNDLNMYITGNYNVVTSIADMNIFGSLTKNITNVFGKIRNASLNTLFNTIPGVNDSTEKLLLDKEISKIPNIKDATNIYRIFTVDVNGDINGDNYVKSFKWVK